MAGVVHRRRSALAAALISGLTAAALALGPAPDQAPAAAGDAPGPNIVVVMSDDQGPGMMQGAADRRPRARHPRRRVRERVRHLPALLPRASHPAHRPVRPQPRHARQQPAQRRWLPVADRPGSEPRRLAPGRRLRHRLRRQVAERVADPPQAAARLGQLVGAGRRGRRRPLLVLRLRRLRGGRHAAPLRQRDRRLPDRRAHPRLRAALHRRPGGRARAVLPLARLPPTALGDRPRRRRRAGAAPTARRPTARASRARSRRRATRATTCAPRSPGRPPSTSATSPTSRSWSAAGRRSPIATSRRSTATTAAGWRRCGRSTTASARSSPSSAPPDSSRTR